MQNYVNQDTNSFKNKNILVFNRSNSLPVNRNPKNKFHNSDFKHTYYDTQNYRKLQRKNYYFPYQNDKTIYGDHRNQQTSCYKINPHTYDYQKSCQMRPVLHNHSAYTYPSEVSQPNFQDFNPINYMCLMNNTNRP